MKLGLRRVIRREEQPTASEAADAALKFTLSGGDRFIADAAVNLPLTGGDGFIAEATVNLPLTGGDRFIALNRVRGVK